MSWIFNGDSSFDAAVEKATSEMIPAGQEDMALFLELCDKIRSRGVPPKDAMRSLKKRIGHKNPNVQLFALKLADVCVKNGGGHFLAEVASREFMDHLVSTINAPTVNHEVKSKILALIQLWAAAFKTRPELSYVVDTYDNLKDQGFQFPSINEKLSEVMIDTTAPPVWTDSDVCERCRQLFTLTNRKHHCRSCGKTFCQACSARNIPLPDMGLSQNVRVCESCFNKRTKEANGGSSSSTMTKSQSSLSTTQRALSSQSKEEEELQRAIALSLLESEKSKTASRKTSEPEEESPVSAEDDPELAAAIAASLKDLKVKEKKEAAKKEVPSAYPSMEKNSSYGSTAPPKRTSSVSESAPATYSASNVSSGAVASSSGLSQTEMQNVSLFHQLMEKMDSDPTGRTSANILNDHELRVLYDAMTAVHPKLVKNIEELVEQHRNLMDLHDKLTGAVGTYDKLIEERLKQQQQQQQQQQAPPQPVQQPHGAYYQPPPAGPYQHAYTHPYPHPAQAYNHQHYYAPPPATVTPTVSNTPPPPGASPYQQQQQQYHQHAPSVSSSPSAASGTPGYVAVPAHPPSQPAQQPVTGGYYPGYYAPPEAHVAPAGYASPPPPHQHHPGQQAPAAGQPQPQQPEKPLIEF